MLEWLFSFDLSCSLGPYGLIFLAIVRLYLLNNPFSNFFLFGVHETQRISFSHAAKYLSITIFYYMQFIALFALAIVP